MNSDTEGSITDELNDRLSEKKINSETKEKGIQVELNINKSDKNKTDSELITAEGYGSPQEFDKNKYLSGIVEKSLLDTSIKFNTINEIEKRVIGTRTKQNIVHTQLQPVTRKPRAKMAEAKLSLKDISSLIPNCADEKDVYAFIRACDYACEAIEKEQLPLLTKFIATKLTGKALDVCRYRETSTWDNIKFILKSAFEQPLSPQILQISLNSLRMRNDEDVQSYNGRVEKLYYNLCSATVANKPAEEAKILRQAITEQALAIYINGLKMNLQTIIRARDPKTLEVAMQLARQLEIELSHFILFYLFYFIFIGYTGFGPFTLQYIFLH